MGASARTTTKANRKVSTRATAATKTTMKSGAKLIESALKVQIFALIYGVCFEVINDCDDEWQQWPLVHVRVSVYVCVCVLVSCSFSVLWTHNGQTNRSGTQANAANIAVYGVCMQMGASTWHVFCFHTFQTLHIPRHINISVSVKFNPLKLFKNCTLLKI